MGPTAHTSNTDLIYIYFAVCTKLTTDIASTELHINLTNFGGIDINVYQLNLRRPGRKKSKIRMTISIGEQTFSLLQIYRDEAVQVIGQLRDYLQQRFSQCKFLTRKP